MADIAEIIKLNSQIEVLKSLAENYRIEGVDAIIKCLETELKELENVEEQ